MDRVRSWSSDLLVLAAVSPSLTNRLGIRRVQRLRASLRQFKQFRRKPSYSIRMGLFYFAKIDPTNLVHAGIRRHSKIAPPPGLYGSLRGLLTLLLPLSLGAALLVGLLPTVGSLFSFSPALMQGPPFAIGFRLRASRA
jgi:hypothetical protein